MPQLGILFFVLAVIIVWEPAQRTGNKDMFLISVAVMLFNISGRLLFS